MANLLERYFEKRGEESARGPKNPKHRNSQSGLTNEEEGELTREIRAERAKQTPQAQARRAAVGKVFAEMDEEKKRLDANYTGPKIASRAWKRWSPRLRAFSGIKK